MFLQERDELNRQLLLKTEELERLQKTLDELDVEVMGVCVRVMWYFRWGWLLLM